MALMVNELDGIGVGKWTWISGGDVVGAYGCVVR